MENKTCSDPMNLPVVVHASNIPHCDITYAAEENFLRAERDPPNLGCGNGGVQIRCAGLYLLRSNKEDTEYHGHASCMRFTYLTISTSRRKSLASFLDEPLPQAVYQTCVEELTLDNSGSDAIMLFGAGIRLCHGRFWNHSPIAGRVAVTILLSWFSVSGPPRVAQGCVYIGQTAMALAIGEQATISEPPRLRAGSPSVSNFGTCRTVSGAFLRRDEMMAGAGATTLAAFKQKLICAAVEAILSDFMDFCGDLHNITVHNEGCCNKALAPSFELNPDAAAPPVVEVPPT
ncbi:hypothetical protein FN846DRAFT_896198 [Sphaerosporella brunnea]|uniref:Uncharacterized protein n=1 Tax=Sphaerosporella brunnea TaxID=1250544 RepID=A0A5J5ECW0_9PEZI|nr:hypothetical protein FN846DRAFT_896198 [Sphaerosporella brunnea]